MLSLLDCCDFADSESGGGAGARQPVAAAQDAKAAAGVACSISHLKSPIGGCTVLTVY
jgi:hypothetical protein